MVGRRGEHLLDAAVGVVAGGGLEALSVRAVAAAAGVSAAQVQYYFRTKDELLGAAFEHVSDGYLARVTAAVRTVPPGAEPDAVLRTVLAAWWPLDEATDRAARVWLAFTAAAATSPALGAANARLDAEVRDALEGGLREAVAAGALVAGTDVTTEARLLLAVVDGLVLQSLAVPTGERAPLLTAALDTYLRRLFRSRGRARGRRPRHEGGATS